MMKNYIDDICIDLNKTKKIRNLVWKTRNENFGSKSQFINKVWLKCEAANNNNNNNNEHKYRFYKMSK